MAAQLQLRQPPRRRCQRQRRRRQQWHRLCHCHRHHWGGRRRRHRRSHARLAASEMDCRALRAAHMRARGAASCLHHGSRQRTPPSLAQRSKVCAPHTCTGQRANPHIEQPAERHGRSRDQASTHQLVGPGAGWREMLARNLEALLPCTPYRRCRRPPRHRYAPSLAQSSASARFLQQRHSPHQPAAAADMPPTADGRQTSNNKS